MISAVKVAVELNRVVSRTVTHRELAFFGVLGRFLGY